MPGISIRLKVADYDKWLQVFEAGAEIRKNAGSLGATVYQEASDPNSIMMIIRFADMDSVTGFMKSLGSEQGKAKGKEAGVISPPEVVVLSNATKVAN